MRKAIILTMLLVLCMAMPAGAEQYRKGNFVYILCDPGNEPPYAILSSIINDPGPTLVIPASVEKNNVTYTVTTIGSGFFGGVDQTDLDKMVIPPTIKRFCKGAFTRLGRCDEVHISDLAAWAQADFEDIAANPIRYMMYLNGEKLTNVVIPDGVTKISHYAFYYCASIQSLKVPSSVTQIGYRSFEGCPVKTLELSEGLDMINHYAFRHCTKLTSVTFPASITFVGGESFSESALASATFLPNENEVYVGYDAFSQCSSLANLRLPENMNELNRVVKDCVSLKSLWIPPTVRLVRCDPFEGCTNLTRLDISSLSDWCRIDYNKSGYQHEFPKKNQFELYLNGEKVTDLEIPSDITSIYERAFNHIKGIESITLHDNVTTVGKYAFGSGMTVSLSNSVTEAGDYAFPSSVKKVYYRSAVPVELNYAAFPSRRSATLIVPRGSIETFYSSEPWLYFGNILEMNFSSIDEVEVADDDAVCDVYSLSGIKVSGGVRWADRLEGLAPGLYIVRLPDGSARKIMAK